MFDETPQSGQSAQPVANQAKGVEDIFAATDKSLAGAGAATPPAAPLSPVSSTPPLGPPTALAQGKLQPASGAAGTLVPPGQLSGAAGLSSHANRLILMIAIGVVLAGGTFVGWWLWPGRKTGEAVLPPVNPIQTSKEAVEKGGAAIGNAIENIQQDSMQKALNPFEQKPSSDANSTGLEPAATTTDSAGADDKTDTDQDGLTDAEETALGTNPRLVDTDGDGLSDWEEVKVWDTKPLTVDTDNDTYSDGHEVQNGYNPNGPGKLLDFEKAKQKAQ